MQAQKTILKDKTGAIALLIASEIGEEYIYCGFACIRGGCRKIEVFDRKGDSYLIEPPDSGDFNYRTYLDKTDMFPIKLIS